MNRVVGRRSASVVVLIGLLMAFMALAGALPAGMVLVGLLLYLIAEVHVQRSAELRFAVWRGDLDERQEAERGQLLATTYRAALLILVGIAVLFALLGDALVSSVLYQLGLVARSNLFGDWLAGALAWLAIGTALFLSLLPAHVAAWRARPEERVARVGDLDSMMG